ncbi:MAG: hypothetical protein DSY33_01160 [Archaeoglobus sp.]|nr:MAG: hypothetical protein DSY33_01160 [Archaeoglobus sp.]
MNQDYKVSNVNWKKLLENYRNNYNYGEEWEITLLELIANSIDAEATKINLHFNHKGKKLDIICKDNGKGMDYSEFEEYHNLGSLSKDRQSKSIGFAGIGAKLCLDLCDKVYTETSDGERQLATEWFFDHAENLPKYAYVRPKNRLKFHTGTFVEISGLRIRDFFDLESAKKLILENYRYILVPFGEIELKINNEQIIFEGLEKEYEQFGKIKSKRTLNEILKARKGVKFEVIGSIYILEFAPKNPRVKIDTGLDIVVCGKKICGGELFGLQYNVKPNYYVLGYIRCDELIQIVQTSKDRLNKHIKIWSEFQKGIAKLLEKYFKEEKIWRDPTKEINDLKTRMILEDIGEDLNSIITRIPEFYNLFDPIKRKTLIRDDRGEIMAKESETGQLTTGTIGGPNPGSNETVPTEGPDNVKGIEKGNEKKALKKDKKVRGVKITIEDLQGIKERVIFMPHDSLFVINSAHPAYKFSEIIGAIDVYMYFVLIDHIVRYSKEHGLIEGSVEDYFWRFYDELTKRYSF